jgi:hypothetical protein
VKYFEQLEQLVNRYFTEPHKIYKYVDANGDSLRAAFHFESRFEYLNQYLDFYKQLSSLSEVIDYACNARFQLRKNGKIYEITHPHQQYFIGRDKEPRGIESYLMKEVESKVQEKIALIESAVTFDDIKSIVSNERVKGFGELAVYDSAVRIATYLDITLDKVYLHAGAQEGAKQLERKGLIPVNSSSLDCIQVLDMPKPLQKLHPIQIENFLCSFKSEIENL